MSTKTDHTFTVTIKDMPTDDPEAARSLAIRHLSMLDTQAGFSGVFGRVSKIVTAD